MTSVVWSLLAQGEAAEGVGVTSVWEFMVKGGPMMIPIGIASALALAIAVERLLVLRRRNVVPPGFMDGLAKAMDPDDPGHAAALKYCENRDSPIARVVAEGIRKLPQGAALVEKHITDQGEWESFQLRRRLRVMSVIASIAPLMGLVGTIFGMIKAFQTVALSAEALGRTELLAEGIYEAMITTAAGLLVAIPALIFYHWISSRIERLVAEMDRVCVRFVERYVNGGGAPAPAARERDAEAVGAPSMTGA